MSQVIRNWSDCNAGLKQRGRLIFWIEADVLQGWVEPELSGKRGASRCYSDVAIATMETIKSVYGLAGRQCQGFLASIFGLMGLDLAVPDHSTLSRRLGQLTVSLPVVDKATAACGSQFD